MERQIYEIIVKVVHLCCYFLLFFLIFGQNRISILIFAVIVLLYQTLRTLFEWAYIGDLTQALQDYRMDGVDMLLQIVGGRLVVRST